MTYATYAFAVLSRLRVDARDDQPNSDKEEVPNPTRPGGREVDDDSCSRRGACDQRHDLE
jgi:hypothetical protein